MNVRCDGCGAQDIAGTRWKCQGCSNFDFCDTCFSTDTLHRRAHIFSCIDQPLEHYQSVQLRHGKTRKISSDHLDFDHVIYLFNCILQAGPRATTKSKFASIKKITGFIPDFLTRMVKGLVSIQRVEIKAEHVLSQFHTIENGDYWAAPVLK
jgi:hypothetical protein